MAQKHKVIFYPVGNGDTAQVVLSNGRRLLFDFNHVAGAEEGGTPEIDLKRRLRDELEEAKRDYFDVVAFTHADRDHISGSTDFFRLTHEKQYQGAGRIDIRELWVPAAMLLEAAGKDEQQKEFVTLRDEARFRLLQGTGIRVFSRPPELLNWLIPRLKERGEAAAARDHLFVDAGTLVNGFNLATDGVEFFCHSPFIKHVEGGDIVRNEASLILNVRFTADGTRFDFLQVGDTEWEALEDIIRITRAHKNSNRLDWDLYNIPHHCSYLALSDAKGEEETEPKQLIQDLLRQGRPDSYVISSSNPIADVKAAYDETQPPHIQARKAYERYLKEVGGRAFLVTMEEPNASKPEPIIIEITSGGGSWTRAGAVGAASIITSRPPRAG